MNCAQVDELAAAFALDAVEPDERRAILAHLETCSEPHADLYAAVGVGAALTAGLAPIAPRPELRERVMASVASMRQELPSLAPAELDEAEQRPRESQAAAPVPERRSFLGWLSPSTARSLALGGAAMVLVLLVVSASLYGRLAERERELRAAAIAIAGSDVAYHVSGEAGRGYVVETAGVGATLVLGDVRSLPDDRLYELWLIPHDGNPEPAGTFRPTDSELTVVPVALDLVGYATFAVTVEEAPVDSPTGDPVLIASLQS
jgi:anti-sigma-K factor RskA